MRHLHQVLTLRQLGLGLGAIADVLDGSTAVLAAQAALLDSRVGELEGMRASVGVLAVVTRTRARPPSASRRLAGSSPVA